MSQTPLAPPPPEYDGRWMNLLWRRVASAGQVLWSYLDFTGSNLTDIATRNHADLQNLNTASYTHLSATNATGLTDAGDSILHYHATDRALANATGTLAVENGGTELTTLTAHAVYVGNGTSAPTAVAVGASNTFLKGATGADPAFGTATLASADFANQGTTTTLLHGNAAGNPSWGAVAIVAETSGTLTVARGGTNLTAIADASILVTNAADTLTVLTAGASQSVRRNAGNTLWEPFTPNVGTVTSVAETVSVATAPTVNLSVAGSPITTAGTLALTISPWLLAKQSVDVGETLNVPVNYGFPVPGNFVVRGTLEVRGDMRVM